MKALYDPYAAILAVFDIPSTRRSHEDRKRMHHLNRPQINFQRISPWAFPPSRFSNLGDEITFQEMLADKDLWLVREEERLVFETSQVIRVAEAVSGDCDSLYS